MGLLFASTVEARFSGHRYSEKPRFKGHSSENLGDHFLFLVYISQLEMAENLDLEDKSLVTDFSTKWAVHTFG